MNTHSKQRSPVITEDLTEAQLAEVAFGTEVVVFWSDCGERAFGIIVGYEDPALPGSHGRFIIDPVSPGPDADRAEDWVETGEAELRLARGQFQVFGPANRDPGDREAEHTSDGWDVVEGTGPLPPQDPELPTVALEDRSMTPFFRAVIDLIAEKQIDTGLPAFEVRLDADVNDKDPDMPRKYRILVRPTMQRLLHDEIEKVLAIASRYELCAWHSNAGLEIRRSGEAPA